MTPLWQITVLLHRHNLARRHQAIPLGNARSSAPGPWWHSQCGECGLPAKFRERLFPRGLR